MDSFFIGVITLFFSGFIASLFKKQNKITVLSILTLIASVLCLIPAVNVLMTLNILSQTFEFNKLFGIVNFQIDALSAFFVIVICIMSTISIFYSKGYLQPYVDKGKNINPHLVFLPVLIASMLTVVTCHHAIMFLICWEIMSLSSFFLVIFEDEKKEVLKAGIKYLVFMHLSVLFIMVGFAMLALKSGSFDFSTFSNVLQKNHHFANIIFTLLFIGFGTKAGFVPFHNWLPDAHPAAPSHVSAMMSGVMIKTGIYGILRILVLIGTPSKSIAFAVLIISILSALYGVLYAITQHDLKRLLAYSSIENISIIGMGLGVGMLGMAYNVPIIALFGFAGGILHILNHAIFKELLFLTAGNIYLKTHTKDIEILGGLIKSMPRSGILFLIGSVAICGLPPFNGFISEFLVYIGLFRGLGIPNFFACVMILFAIAGLALVGTMSILCFTKAFSIIFLGAPRSDKAKQVQEDCSNSMIIPMCILASFIFLIGLCPDIVFAFMFRPISTIIGNIPIPVADIENSIMLMRIVALCTFVLLLTITLAIILKLKLSRRKISVHETWGCGYNKPNNNMQYTASSYASPFLSMLKPLFKKVFDIEKPRKLFPKSGHFSLQIEDIEEVYVINPLVKYDEWFLSKFEAFQSGNLQSYIKYGLIFLVIVIIGSLFIG